MSNYGSRKPLNMQPEFMAKARKTNPSYESFRPNEIHQSEYKAMDDRPTTSDVSRLRRYPDGKLDFENTVAKIMGALSKAEAEGYLTPLEESLLTVVFPLRFRKTEPQQAEIRTQLSRSEKDFLKEMVEARIKEQNNWSAGRGGGSVEGRSRTTG